MSLAYVFVVIHIALCTRVLLADRPIAASRTGKRRPCSLVGRISGCRSGPRASLQGRPTTLAWPSLLRSSRCPLYPRKRTLSDTTRMSALCQKRTNAPQQNDVRHTVIVALSLNTDDCRYAGRGTDASSLRYAWQEALLAH